MDELLKGELDCGDEEVRSKIGERKSLPPLKNIARIIE